MMPRPTTTLVYGLVGGTVIAIASFLNAANALVEPMVGPGVVIAAALVEAALGGSVMVAAIMLYLRPLSRTPWGTILLVVACVTVAFPAGPLNIFLPYSLLTGAGCIVAIASGAMGMFFRVRVGARANP